MYKKILVTSGVVSSLLFTGAATTFAQTGMMNQVKDTRPMHRMITAERIADMATKLGLNADEIQKELDAGKKLPEILQQHNITKEQIRNVLAEQTGNDHPIKKVRTNKK